MTTIPKIALEHYYLTENHTQGECSRHFQRSIGSIERLIKVYGLVKTQDQKEEIKVQAHIKKAITQRKFIPRDDLIRYHLVENRSIPECVRHFAVSRKTIQRRLREFGLEKSPSLQQACANRPASVRENPSSVLARYNTNLSQAFSFVLPVQEILNASEKKNDFSVKHSFSLTVKKPQKQIAVTAK
jgi:transposase